MGHSSIDPVSQGQRPWNEGRLLGAKRTLKQQQVWAIRFWLDQHRRLRNRALFDFAIDSKLRSCDMVKRRIGNIVSGGPCVKSPMVGNGNFALKHQAPKADGAGARCS